jgi:hypothetical protein
MNRLTNTSFEEVMNNLDAFDLIEWQEEIYNKLAEYENTNLTPQEVLELKQNQNKVAIEKLENLYNCFNEINNVPFNCEPSIIMNRDFALNKINSMIQELKGGSNE